MQVGYARLPAHRHSVMDLPRRVDPPDGGRGRGSHTWPTGCTTPQAYPPEPEIHRAGVAVRVIVHSRVDASAGG